MWLMTKYGFYSIVCKEGRLHIRARDKAHLVELGQHWNLGEIRHDVGTDYPYRHIVSEELAVQVIAWLGTRIDYENFKGEVARKWEFQSAYHAFLEVVWASGREMTRLITQGGKCVSVRKKTRRKHIDR